MDYPQKADVVMIGGGVMGASTAYHLAARGQKNVLLLEKEEFFGQGATGRCAGGVRYQFATQVNVRLSLASLPMLERLKTRLDRRSITGSAGICSCYPTRMTWSLFKTTGSCKTAWEWRQNGGGEMKFVAACP